MSRAPTLYMGTRANAGTFTGTIVGLSSRVPVRVGDEELRLVDMFKRLAEPSHEELLVVSPYLIPDALFLEDLRELSVEGVDAKILTSSLGSNNQTPTHSHNRKYRRRIFAAGADPHEFKHEPSAFVRTAADVPSVQAGRLACT